MPVSVRLTHQGKSLWIPTGFYADKSDIGRDGTLRNTSPLFKKTNSLIAEYYTRMTASERDIRKMTVHQVKDLICNNPLDKIDFFKFADDELAKIKVEGTWRYYYTSLKNFKTFVGKPTFSVEDMSVELLVDYEASVKKRGKQAPNTYIGAIKTLWLRMIKHYRNSSIPNPFLWYQIPKRNVPEKRGLLSDDIRKILAVEPITPRGQLAKDVFTISLLMVGTNAIDILNMPAPVKDSLAYERTKTKNRRDDKAYIKIRIEPELKPLLEKYKGDNQYAFCFNKMYTCGNCFNGALNVGLKEILALLKEPLEINRLTFYTARCSWATIARNECGIAKYDIHEFLNHSDREMKITDIYIRKNWQPLAEANRKVIDKIFAKKEQNT
jgi:integrase